jgi:hypothetical protein
VPGKPDRPAAGRSSERQRPSLLFAVVNLLLARSPGLGPLLRTRSTQTNEIRRCVAFRLGLDLFTGAGRSRSR